MSESTLGLSRQMGYFVSYILGWLSGIFVLIKEKSDQDVRFHAAQSVVLFGGLFVVMIALSIVISIIPALAIISTLFYLAYTVIWVGMVVMAWLEKPPVLPVVSDFAKKLLAKA